MSVAELIQNLTYSQFNGIVGDFILVLDRCGRLAADESVERILPAEKYEAVLKTLNAAEAAAAEGRREYFHFLRGVAAALYGLPRLEEAGELEKQLGRALGLTPPECETPTSKGPRPERENTEDGGQGHNASAQNDQRAAGRKARAAAVAALLACAGIDEEFDFGTCEDACYAVLEADWLLFAAETAREQTSIAGLYWFRDRHWPSEKLARLIAEKAGSSLPSKGWTPSQIEAVLVIANDLIADGLAEQNQSPAGKENHRDSA